MASPKRTVLGVEIGAREVRMVEMRGGATPRILKAGTVPLPAGAMDGDRIVQPDAVAEIIRGLHTRLDCSAKSAVVGMGIQGVVTRILAIPRVPDSELRTVIEGELAHYQILRAGTGAFDFFRLEAPSTESDTLPSVLLMAVEERIAQGYRQAVEKAGLQLLALEPITLALFRAAFPMLQAEPAALCLAITPQRSELSILDHSQVRLYRRLEMGSNDFIRGRAGTQVGLAGPSANDPRGPQQEQAGGLYRARMALTLDEDDTGELDPSGVPLRATEGDASGVIIPQAAATFANEIQRSLDYYRREFPNATAISRIILPTNDPEAEGLAQWLSDALRIDVRVAEPPTDPSLPRATAAQLEAPQGLRFLGGAGLALQVLTPDWKQVPHFNLATGSQSAVMPVERDRLTAVMIMAVCILIGGLFFGSVFNQKAQRADQELQDQQRILQVRTQENEHLDKVINDEMVLARIIKSDNLPIPAILDIISSNMPPGLGLTNVNIQRNGHITIEGNARDLQNFNLYYFGLMQCPHFVAPRYQSLTTDPNTRLTHFRVETSLKGTQDATTARASGAP